MFTISVQSKTRTTAFFFFLFQAGSEKTINCQIFIVNPNVTDVPLLVFAVAVKI